MARIGWGNGLREVGSLSWIFGKFPRRWGIGVQQIYGAAVPTGVVCPGYVWPFIWALFSRGYPRMDACVFDKWTTSTLRDGDIRRWPDGQTEGSLSTTRGRVSQGYREWTTGFGIRQGTLAMPSRDAITAVQPSLGNVLDGMMEHAYAPAAKTLHNHRPKTQEGENARPRRYHSPRPTRAGAICSYPQPPHSALLSACQERGPEGLQSIQCLSITQSETSVLGGKDGMRRGANDIRVRVYCC